MSTTSLNFHNVVEASARVQSVNDTKWLNLTFTDDKGATLDIAIFSDSPEELLKAIAIAAALDDAQTGNEQPKCTYPNCDCAPNGDVGCNSPNAAAGDAS
jgi:hypothetical protein